MRVRDKLSRGMRSTLAGIYIGAGIFLLALLWSAALVPDLRGLHALQSLIYLTVIALASRNSAWAYGAASSVALFWNVMGLFVTHLIQTGANDLWLLLRTGHANQFVPMSVTLGGIGHFILLGTSLLGVTRFDREPRKWWKFAGGGVLSIAYFALLIALFQPH